MEEQEKNTVRKHLKYGEREREIRYMNNNNIFLHVLGINSNGEWLLLAFARRQARGGLDGGRRRMQPTPFEGQCVGGHLGKDLRRPCPRGALNKHAVTSHSGPRGRDGSFPLIHPLAFKLNTSEVEQRREEQENARICHKRPFRYVVSSEHKRQEIFSGMFVCFLVLPFTVLFTTLSRPPSAPREREFLVYRHDDAMFHSRLNRGCKLTWKKTKTKKKKREKIP